MKNVIKITLLSSLTIFLLISCGNSSKSTSSKSGGKKKEVLQTIHKDSLKNVMTIQTPTTASIVIHNAYIHSLKKVMYKGNEVLLIQGTLPDGCSKLYHVDKKINDTTLKLIITTWKPRNKVCTQALKHFTFIYHGLNYFDFHSITHYVINGKTKAF